GSVRAVQATASASTSRSNRNFTCPTHFLHDRQNRSKPRHCSSWGSHGSTGPLDVGMSTGCAAAHMIGPGARSRFIAPIGAMDRAGPHVTWIHSMLLPARHRSPITSISKLCPQVFREAVVKPLLG